MAIAKEGNASEVRKLALQGVDVNYTDTSDEVSNIAVYPCY